MKKCPYCAEEIQEDAVYCRHCHKGLDGFKNNKPKQISPWQRLLLDLLGTPLGIFVTYVCFAVTGYFLFNSLNISSYILCPFLLLGYFIYVKASQIRRKYLSEEEREAEDDQDKYWQERGR
jgi:hypothetical protein